MGKDFRVNVIVVCMSCGKMAPSKGADANNPFGVFLWHQPCPYCGAENWGAHDPSRDLRTGRLLTSAERKEGECPRSCDDGFSKFATKD